jgi:hypothetical protein
MMNESERANTAAGVGGSSGRWLAFVAGIAAGVGLSALLIGGAIAERRRARRALPWNRRHVDRTAPTLYPPAARWRSFDERSGAAAARSWPEDAALDDELEQTFPASDPLPYSHRVD